MEIILIAIGILIGSSISNIVFYRRTSYGMLLIDHSDPEKDVYRITLNSLDDLDKKKRIMLRVDNDADLS